MTDLTRMAWRKSSRSGGNNGQCVELACRGEGLAVRDSKNPKGGVLLAGRSAAAGFLAAVKSGRLDG